MQLDEQTKKELFQDLGYIKANIRNIKDTQSLIQAKQEQLDGRLRRQEVKSGGISAVVSLVMVIILDTVKKGISGGP